MAKKEIEKVGGKFVADSEVGRMYTFLSDGQAHTKEDVIKAVKPQTGRIINKTKRLQDWGKKSGDYTLTVSDDTLHMVLAATGTAKKPAKKSASPKK